MKIRYIFLLIIQTISTVLILIFLSKLDKIFYKQNTDFIYSIVGISFMLLLFLFVIGILDNQKIKIKIKKETKEELLEKIRNSIKVENWKEVHRLQKILYLK